MGRKKKSAVGVRKYGMKSNYSQIDLNEALDKIKTCKLSQREAAKLYKIPRSTIKYKLKGEHNKPVGKPIALSQSEEAIFISHIVTLADLGIPIGMHDVRIIIKKYLDDVKKTIKQFTNNMPGWEWGKNFLDRHPEIKQRIGHNISRKRAQINKEMIEIFFDHLKTELADIPPENIYNFDETGFHDNPKKAKLLFRRTCRNPEIIKNATKSCFTAMFCGNAKGEFLPPFIVYKAKQKWSDWLEGAPPETRMAVTKSGWMDVETFDEWFESQVLPVLKRKQGKKAIIGDNLSSHVSIKTLKLCEENDIKFICLIPNSTHLLQPLDVAYFSSLKTNWRSVLSDWRNTKRGKIATVLPKNIFASLLNKTLDLGKDSAGPNIVAGFNATGLFPCDVNKPLKKLPDYGKPIEEMTEKIGDSFKQYIDDIRNSDLEIKQKKKFQIPIVAGKSVSVEEVQKFIDNREESKNKPKKAIKKRGRPVGSKTTKQNNNVKKKKIDSVCDTQDLERVQETVENVMKNTNEKKRDELEDCDVENSQNVANVYPNSNESDECVKITEREEDYIIERFEINDDGKLKRQVVHYETKTVDSYCIVNYEGILFPGRIVQSNHPNYKVSFMQKAEAGWIWPKKVENHFVNGINIIRVLDDTSIIKNKGHYTIEDDFLAMEWGD